MRRTMNNVTPERTLERNREGVRRWYYAHREEYAEVRRRRYATDADRREKAVRRARLYREEAKRLGPSGNALTRVYKGKTIEVYTTGYVAAEIGCQVHH